MEIRISSKDEIEEVNGQMHDSEFDEKDFSYNSNIKTFYLKTHSSPVISKEEKDFILELYNVEKYDSINLDKIKAKKAIAGVFNRIKIRNNGLNLTLMSQDLRIELTISKLDGKFKIIKKFLLP